MDKTKPSLNSGYTGGCVGLEGVNVVVWMTHTIEITNKRYVKEDK